MRLLRGWGTCGQLHVAWVGHPVLPQMNRVTRPAVVSNFKSASDEARGGRLFTGVIWLACTGAAAVGLSQDYKGNSSGEHVLTRPQRYLRSLYERIVTGSGPP